MTTGFLLFALGLLAVVGGGVVVACGLALGAAFPLVVWLRREAASTAVQPGAAAAVAIHRLSPAVVVMHGLEGEEPSVYADHILMHGLSAEQAVQVMLTPVEAQA